MSDEEIDVDELFMEGLSALIASLCAMHPMQLKSALEVVDKALEKTSCPPKNSGTPMQRFCECRLETTWQEGR